MALLWSYPSPFPFLQHNKHSSLISKTTTILNISPVSIYSSPIKHYTTLQTLCCSSSSSSSLSSSSSKVSDKCPSSRVFIKGLPLSTTAGRLKNAFSQFGEVSQVKIVTQKKSKQPLGYAYVWFTSEDSAQLAVKEMNGKFFDGRFVFVAIADPGFSKTMGRVKQYKF